MNRHTLYATYIYNERRVVAQESHIFCDVLKPLTTLNIEAQHEQN